MATRVATESTEDKTRWKLQVAACTRYSRTFGGFLGRQGPCQARTARKLPEELIIHEVKALMHFGLVNSCVTLHRTITLDAFTFRADQLIHIILWI